MNQRHENFDEVHKNDMPYLMAIIEKNKRILKEISESKKCMGDKARLICEKKIVNNLVFARKILEMI